MFRQSVRAISSKRLFSVSVRSQNSVADLYIQQVKQFKPTPLSTQEIESAVKSFKLPSKPSIPESEISTEALGEYEASEVETQTVSSSGAENVAAEEDWFVFEEEEVHH